MVLPERLAEEFAEKLGFISCTVPVFDQLILAELISGGSFERHINRIRRQKRKIPAVKAAENLQISFRRLPEFLFDEESPASLPEPRPG